MESLIFIVSVLVILAVPLICIGGIVLLISRTQSRYKNRTAQMQAVANQMKWTFTEVDVHAANALHKHSQRRLLSFINSRQLPARSKCDVGTNRGHSSDSF